MATEKNRTRNSLRDKLPGTFTSYDAVASKQLTQAKHTHYILQLYHIKLPKPRNSPHRRTAGKTYGEKVAINELLIS